MKMVLLMVIMLVKRIIVDNVNAGKTLFEMYDITGKEKYRKSY